MPAALPLKIRRSTALYTFPGLASDIEERGRVKKLSVKKMGCAQWTL